MTIISEHSHELLGLDAPHQSLRRAMEQGRMPHAWLLRGMKGVGKASLATAFASEILEQGNLVYTHSHPDMMLLTPAEGKAIIDVDTVREAVGFARSTPSLGRWRVLLLDSADDLNTAAANALLKVLEEPGGQTLLFLVSHNAGKLLPTIRSRCVVLRCPVPDYETFAEILSRHAFSATREVYDTSHGSPGIALEYLQGGLSEVLRSASAMLDHLGEHSLSEKLAFADTLAAAARQAPAVWQALARLWLGWCHRQLRQAAVHHLPYTHVFPRWQACDALRTLLQQAPALYMDARSVTLSALRYLEKVEGRGSP